MRRAALTFLLFCLLCTNAQAQSDVLERDSLPVFVIQNREFASIVGDFIADAKNVGIEPYQSRFISVDITNIDENSSDIFYIYINIREDDTISLLVNLREQNLSPDSLILYKNPHFHQALIKHQDVMFRANITSYAAEFNYDMLTDMIKRLPMKQVIYYKDPPLNFYDLNLQGGHPMKDTVLDSFHVYDGTTWDAPTPFEDDRELTPIVIVERQ